MSRQTKTFTFSMNESSAWCTSMYQSHVDAVIVRSSCGKKLQFSKHHLRPFITHTGINGRFKVSITEQNRFVSIEKIA